MDVVKKYKIKRYINGELIEVDDDIVVEYLFTIYINEYEYITLICTPSSLLHLAVGFLYSDEIITSYNDINSINVFEKEGYVDIKIVNKNNINNKLNEKRAITSGCGKGSIYYKSLKNNISLKLLRATLCTPPVFLNTSDFSLNLFISLFIFL